MLNEQQSIEALAGLGSTVALDLETTGLDQHKDQILGVAICDNEQAYYLSPDCVKHLADALKDKTVVLHNFTFDLKFLHEAGCDLYPHNIVDTKILHHLQDENKPHALSDVIKDVLGIDDTYKKDFWEKYKTAQDAPPEELEQYAKSDVKYTLQAYYALKAELQGKATLINHVHKLAVELYFTERDGIPMDLDYTMGMGEKLQERIQCNRVTMRKLCEVACEDWEMQEWVKQIEKRKTDKGKANVPKPEFSFSSNKQLGELLYDIMGIEEQINKKSKSRTVDDEALLKIENKHPVIPVIRDNREAEKIYGTYVQGILDRVVHGRVYPSFNVCGTVTGRISHSNPNMGNMPRDGGLRGIFVPSSNHSLISADYSQLEICLAAHFSEDAILLDTVRQNKSMHDITAKALNCDRQLAKTLNFGILYGASKWKVKELFKCSEQEAQVIIDKFFRQFPGLKKIIDYCHERVERDEQITNPFGRTRTFKGQWTNRNELDRCKRQAFNSLIQGTGGDLTNISFYRISRELRSGKLGKAWFTVHDEVLVEARDGAVPEVKEIIKANMVGIGEEIGLLVPLSVEISEPMQRWEK